MRNPALLHLMFSSSFFLITARNSQFFYHKLLRFYHMKIISMHQEVSSFRRSDATKKPNVILTLLMRNDRQLQYLLIVILLVKTKLHCLYCWDQWKTFGIRESQFNHQIQPSCEKKLSIYITFFQSLPDMDNWY